MYYFFGQEYLVEIGTVYKQYLVFFFFLFPGSSEFCSRLSPSTQS